MVYELTQTSLLASTGVSSQSPIFNIALFLPSGLKLGEGHGSSQRMAEHRAAVNALHSFFLVRENSIPPLPTSAHADFPVDLEGILWVEGERFESNGWGGRESNVESSKRLGRGSRGKDLVFGSKGLRGIKEGRDTL
jgi:large subunit ribosomal protein L44